LLILELAGLTAALALFGIASPDTFRDKLWLAGGVYGYNSNPHDRVYYYANYQTPPKIPLIWSQFLTNYNVAISIVFVFALLIKAVLFVVQLFYPVLSFVFHILAIGLWTFSLYAQLSPDYSDPAHPAKFPWYIAKSCDAPAHIPPTPGGLPPLVNIPHYCQMARATLAATVIMIAIYLAYAVFSLHSLFILHRRHSGKEIDNDSITSEEERQDNQVVSSYSQRMNPVTPRTQAFHTLDGGTSLPLRNYPTSA